MSKIGKTPIEIKSGVTVSIDGSDVKVSGPKGDAVYTIPSGIEISQADGKVSLTLTNTQDRSLRALYGLTRAQLANLMKGMDAGFEKKLELQGVGYRAQVQGTELVLSLGFSHPVKFRPHASIKIAVAENIITITGTDKMLVGETAAKIRAIRPPEPYKGKGIRYKGEQVRRKVGKAAKAVGTK
jgi:large subunit ribosomal protein L6